MRAILPPQPRRIVREAGLYALFLLIHYAFFGFYIFCIMLIHMAVKNFELDSVINLPINLYYSVFGAPLMSGVLQIVYEERGGPWFRFLMFGHMMANAITVPIIVLS